jgi:ribosome-binding ATPase
MKICLIGIEGIPLGRHNVRDTRLDQIDKLVEADKKTYAQVEIVGEPDLVNADAILVHVDQRADLILQDLEFIETRLERNPAENEKAVLNKLTAFLESEGLVSAAGLTDEETSAIAAHAFVTSKPIIAAAASELAAPDALILRAFREGGFISFLTVGGKENRAWKIRKGSTAWESAGAIHTDIQKGFIRAEVISFDDLVQTGGETQAKRAGKQRLETKQYVVNDYDVLNFRFNK